MVKKRFLVNLLGVMLALGMSVAMSGCTSVGHSGNGPPGPPQAPPPPPPPSLPPPPTPNDSVIYFGFDQVAISPDAKDVLEKAAAVVAAIMDLDSDYQGQMTHYCDISPTQDLCPPSARAKEAYRPVAVIVAYADTSGSTAHNLRLTEQRAKAAADALVALGVSPADITTSWKGEADPAVNTGDNVKEPLNRRVTIHVGAAGY